MIPLENIETSLSPTILVMGLLVSLVFFLGIFHKGLARVGVWVRLPVTVLRILLCILVWGLIAQPRALIQSTEEAVLQTRIGIDTSQSMSLVDGQGRYTSGWAEGGGPGLLDEAIALTEAAKIRLHLLPEFLGESRGKLALEIEKTGDLLSLAQEKVSSFGEKTGLGRLSSRAGDDLAAAARSLDEIDLSNPSVALSGSAKLTAEAALSLRRIAVLHTKEKAGVTEEKPRLDLVRRWLDESGSLLAEIADRSELRVLTFASDLLELESGDEVSLSESGGEETRLYENLNRLATGDEEERQQISVLITDGMNSPGVGEGEFSAAVRSQPLLVLPIGDLDRSPDVRVESVVSPAQVREGDLFVANVQVVLRNSEASQVTVRLIENETVLDRQEVRLRGDGTAESVELEWKALRGGQKQMRVEVEALPEEKVTYNNSKEVAFEVSKDKYRVLICDAFPRWETRYLQNLFQRDPAMKAKTVIFGPGHTYPGKDPIPAPVLPLSLAEWQEFDLVILGDVDPTQLTPRHQESLIEFVNRGGGLMILAGKNAMPAAFRGTELESLLPMNRVQLGKVEGTFIISPGEDRSLDPMVEIAEEESRNVWRKIYQSMPCYQISPWCKAKQSAQVLLSAQDDTAKKKYDFLALQRYGSGRVAFAAAPCFYHLRFRYGDRYHLRFWGEFVRGMCVGDFGFDGGMVKTRLDDRIWDFGDEVQGRVRVVDEQGLAVTDANFQAVLSKDGEVVARMAPSPDATTSGDYFLRFPGLYSGEYDISYEGGEVGELWEKDREVLAEASGCRFWVEKGPASEEKQFAMTEPAFWSRVNELPLGATIHPQTLGMVLEAIELKPEAVTVTRVRSLWDTWTILILIITIAGLEWLLRRSNGLR